MEPYDSLILKYYHIARITPIQQIFSSVKTYTKHKGNFTMKSGSVILDSSFCKGLFYSS